jgi:hypothetical protein
MKIDIENDKFHEQVKRAATHPAAELAGHARRRCKKKLVSGR